MWHRKGRLPIGVEPSVVRPAVERCRDLYRLAAGLRVVLLVLAVGGMVLTAAVSDCLWRRAVIEQARVDLQRLAVLMAARTAQDVADLGEAEALTRLRKTLAMPTSGMGFQVALLSRDWRVLAATTGAPVEEGDFWPAVPKSPPARARREIDIAGERYLAAFVRVSGADWELTVFQPKAALLPDTAASHWLVLATAALLVLTVGMLLHTAAVRARTEEKALEARAAALALAEAAEQLAMAAVVDADSGRIVKANHDLARALGFDRPDLLEGRRWQEFCDEYLAGRYDNLFQQGLLNGMARGAEIPHPDGRGGIMYLDAIVKPLWPDAREVVMFLSDVTERRLLQEEMARRAREFERRGRRLEEQLMRTVAAAARYRNLVTHSPYSIVVVDARSHRIVEANPQAERELGMTYDQLRGAPVTVLDASRGLRIEELLEQARQEGVVRDAELMMLTPPGEGPKYIAATVSYLVAGEEELFHIILRDVTSERQVRAQVEEAYQQMAAQARRLEEVNEQLRRATEAKSYFLATMSHELRAPLNSIIGFTELLLDETYGKLNDRQRDFLKDVHRASGHLLKLINDVLELARMEAGRITLQISPVGVQQLLRDVSSFTRGAAAEKHQRLTFSVEPGDLMVMADEHRAKQILINLISNAIKYSPPETFIRVEARASGDMVVFSVADQGEGIAPEDQERIFRAFERVERGPQSGVGGFGLGLPLAKYLVERHGGKIWVESTLGAGSTFCFTLPRFEAPAEQPSDKPALPQGEEVSQEGLAGQPIEHGGSTEG